MVELFKSKPKERKGKMPILPKASASSKKSMPLRLTEEKASALDPSRYRLYNKVSVSLFLFFFIFVEI